MVRRVRTTFLRVFSIAAVLSMCSVAAWSEPSDRVQLDNGMPLIVEPVRDISSANDTTGTPVQFRVAHRCRVNGVVLIDKGAIVTGTVSKSQHSKMFGKPGVLEVTFTATTAIDGSPLQVRAGLGKKGNADLDTADKLARCLPYGVGLAFNGRDAILRSGVPLTIFIDETAVFAVPKEGRPVRIGSKPGKPSLKPRVAPDETGR